VEGGGWRVEGGGWRVEGGGWRVEGGGWRVEGGLKAFSIAILPHAVSSKPRYLSMKCPEGFPIG
jgi:hypothetical protein